MRLFLAIVGMVGMLYGTPGFAAQTKPVDIARSFLPPGTELAKLEHFDPRSGKSISKLPAVLTGHLVSPESNDIVFAYVNATQGSHANVLFVSVLHMAAGRYTKVFERSYYERLLWTQDFATAGLRTIRLPGASTDSVLVATSRGASLGVQVELYRWQDGLGLVNVMPEHPPAHHVSFELDNERFLLRLSFEKYPAEKGVPPPLLYHWNGQQLIPGDK